MSTITWLIVGVVAGGLARLLVPGRDELGVVGAVILALLGAVIGGLIGNLAMGARTLSSAGLVGSILGAVGVLLLSRIATGRRTA